MKSWFKVIGAFAIIGYVFLLFFIGKELFFHEEITPTITAKNPNLLQLFILMIVVSFIGFFTLILGANRSVDVIYVEETDKDKLGNSKDTNPMGNTPEHVNGQASSTALKKIEDIILSNQFNKKQLLERILRTICNNVQGVVGAIYISKLIEDNRVLEMVVSYAYYNNSNHLPHYEFGQGLIGQVAKNGKEIALSSVPEAYIKVVSGLGGASPNFLFIFPLKNEEEEVLGVVELASFRPFKERERTFLKDVALLLAKEIETNEYYNIRL